MIEHMKPLAQDYSLVYRRDRQDYFLCGPGLLRLPCGDLLATVPETPNGALQGCGREGLTASVGILASTDGGKSWRERSRLPYYAGIPWLHQDMLYLFAHKLGTQFRNDDLLLMRSADGGQSWSEAVTLFSGHFWNCPTAMVRRPERLYWAMDDLSFGGKRGPCMVIGDLQNDPMDPANWRRSESIPFPGCPESLISRTFRDPARKQTGCLWLEPNVVEVNGRVRVLATVKLHGQSTAGIGAVFDLEGGDQTPDLVFDQFAPMPFGHLKFHVLWDTQSGLFWAAGNMAVDSQGLAGVLAQSANENKGLDPDHEDRHAPSRRPGNDRRFLMLYFSADALNWFQAGCIARAAKADQSFMYPTLALDGDDLAVISRSSVNAFNRHDADCCTFHRVGNFRRLALDLYPQPPEPISG